VERVQGARLALVGLGELRDAAMKRTEHERIPGLHFVGYLTDALPDAYAAADVSLLLAIGNDGYGRALLESMACGTPCVVPAAIPAVAAACSHAPRVSATTSAPT